LSGITVVDRSERVRIELRARLDVPGIARIDGLSDGSELGIGRVCGGT
jgi:hypothetical protein